MKCNFSEEEIQTAVTEWAEENPETAQAIVSNPELLDTIPESKSNAFVQWIKDHPIKFGALIGAIGLGTIGALKGNRILKDLPDLEKTIMEGYIKDTAKAVNMDPDKLKRGINGAFTTAGALGYGIEGALLGTGGGAVANAIINKNFSSTEAEDEEMVEAAAEMVKNDPEAAQALAVTILNPEQLKQLQDADTEHSNKFCKWVLQNPGKALAVFAGLLGSVAPMIKGRGPSIMGAALASNSGLIIGRMLGWLGLDNLAEDLYKDEDSTSEQQKDTDKPAPETHNFSVKQPVASTKGLTRLLGDNYIK